VAKKRENTIMSEQLKTIVIVGAGPIGRSWAKLLLRANKTVYLIDENQAVLEDARQWLKLTPDAKAQISFATDYASCPHDVDWAQESGPDNLAIKQDILKSINAHVSASTLIGSSCSTFDPSELAQSIDNPERFMLVHPFNPPHVIPGVEVVPGVQTSNEAVERMNAYLRAVGQSPIVLKTYAEGLIINRLQGALMREAFSLYCEGIADVGSIDACIADGLALRWVSVGTFGTNHTNAVGGIKEYFTKYADWSEIMGGLTASAPVFTPEFVKKLAADFDAYYGKATVDDMSDWRDRIIHAVTEAKRKDPRPS
jgi:L-gulonate 3-dehydrogenase